MKFSAYLATNLTPEWRKQYIDYKVGVYRSLKIDKLHRYNSKLSTEEVIVIETTYVTCLFPKLRENLLLVLTF